MTDPIQPPIEESVDDLAAAIERGEPVLDVREEWEYDEAHVPGAVLVPLGRVPDHLDEVPAGEPLHVICKSGGRSLKAAEFLRAFGRTAISVAGGTDGWIASGRTVDR